jgi:hypothetical protein
MRTSLLETEQIESQLMRTTEPGDALVFEAKLLLDPELKDKMYWQQKTYNIIRQYGREQLKGEIEAVHRQLFNDGPHQSFRQKIMRLFSKK